MDVAIYCGKVHSWTDEICKSADRKVLDYHTVIDWIKAQGDNSFLIFGTDVIPYSIYDYPERPFVDTQLFKFMERGGTVIWVGDVPFHYVDKDGVKEAIFGRGNPFPFTPVNMEHKPVSQRSENSIVGEMLKYDPKETWRPVPPNPSLIPISVVMNNAQYLYSTWIYKYGRGRFVRLYDSPYVDPSYVMSLPGRLLDLGIGIRIKNFRRFENFQMILPNFKIGVILGKNNVGKTTILEAIAMLDDNFIKIRNTRGRVSDRTSESELFLKGNYGWSKFSSQLLARNSTFKVLLIYSHDITTSLDLQTVPDIQSKLREITDLLNFFDQNIFYVYLSAGNELRVLFKDRTDVPINELGYGYKSLINFIVLYLINKPRIILIDDLEGFAFHPELLKQFYDLLLKLDVDLILITTQSSDVYAYLAEKRSDNVRFVLMNDGKYEVLTSEEALERMYYEDLRYTALKLSGEVHRGGEG